VLIVIHQIFKLNHYLVFLSLVIIGFIIYHVVVKHTHNGSDDAGYVGLESNDAGLT
jgi:hypothetical protein